MKDAKTLIPPNSKESEMMVLGSMLTSVNSLNVAADTLNAADFYYVEHQAIFDVLKTAYKNDKPADVHLVCEELKRLGKLKLVGGPGYITSVAQYAGTSAFIEEYAEVVQSKAILRRMIQTAHEMEKNAFENPGDVHAFLDETQQKLFTISQAAYSQGGVLLRDILSGSKAMTKMPYLKELQIRQEEFQVKGPQDAGITGLPTHFLDLDKMINGLGASNLIILAARPAMGKTALAINIAENICFKSGIPVGIFSLEMSSEQLLHRLICSQSEVESDKLRTGNLTGLEFQKVVAAVNIMQKSTMVIDDQPGLKVSDLRARARRMKETHGIQFLVVDYLQLLSGSSNSKSSENRQNEIAEISRMLKNLARELNIPLLCLSQLSRKVEERPGHRPMMSDLRESGCLTGDALITDALTGLRFSIKELSERAEQLPFWIEAIDPSTEQLKLSLLSKAFYSGRKVVYELKTATGRSIKASANHPFLRKSGWTKLEDLQEKDLIALPRQISIKEPSNLLSKRDLLSISKDHKIPKELFSHSLGDIALVLSQFWQSQEASIAANLCSFKTNCRTFACDMQHLLLRLNIQSHIKQINTQTYSLCIEKSEDIASFLCALITKEIKSNGLSSDIYWDSILSLTKLSEEDVYDATVEENHNFIANDIIVHNSIEQDSDIVAFLLRREYYDPYDKPGLAELIVAKNRHGGVGSVFLAFRKELAQFGNYSGGGSEHPQGASHEDAFAAFSPK